MTQAAKRVGVLIAATWVLGGVSSAAESNRIHEVQPGETLWAIAADVVGDPRLWPALYRANRDQIKNPALLYPGQRLAIPEIDPEMRAAIRRENQAGGMR